MVLAHRILGKFLGVVCHCFPPPLDFPTFTTRCLYVHNDARDPSSERWNCGREIVRQFCLNSYFHLNLGIFYMPQIYDMGPTALLPLQRKACWGFFRPKNPTASAEFEPANLGTKGQHATPRPPNYNNEIILAHFVINKLILVFKYFKPSDSNSITHMWNILILNRITNSCVWHTCVT